mgnify:CR=1 FL=1
MEKCGFSSHFFGIMIATTNLTTNLDKAFERRFIYKIRFDKLTMERFIKNRFNRVISVYLVKFAFLYR